MIFKPKNRTISDHLCPILIDNNVIKYVSHARFLAVIINDQLNWKKHISYVSNKVAINIGIKWVRNILSRKKPYGSI